jgi:hypothetical protein
MKQGLNQSNVFVINSQPGETIPLNVTEVSANVSFFNVASAKNYDCIVTNAGSKVAFIAFGTSSATVATIPGTNGTIYATPVLPGAIYTFQKNTPAIDVTTCAAICASGETTTLYFTSIQGS